MKYVISYSGGLGSFMAAVLASQQHGKENCLLLFADTKIEDEDCYRFVDETAKHLGIELVKIADGRDIWQVFNDERFMGNSRVDPCSKLLKRKPLDRWVKEHFKPDECVRVVGIGHHETHRLGPIQAAFAPYRTWAPLVERHYGREQIEQYLHEIGIEPPRLYDLGFLHNNCGGFCVKTGQRQMLLLLKNFPDRYRWHEEKQEELFAKIGHHGTIKREVNREKFYLSLRQFRELVESNGQLELYNDPGCGCIA